MIQKSELSRPAEAKNLAEIAAEKFRCILTRDKPRDIYDLWYLLKRGSKPDIDLINRKLGIYDLSYDREELLKRIHSFEVKWSKDLKGIVIGSLPQFSVIEDEMKNWIP